MSKFTIGYLPNSSLKSSILSIGGIYSEHSIFDLEFFRKWIKPWPEPIPVPSLVNIEVPYPNIFRRTARKRYPVNSYYFNDHFDEFYLFFCKMITDKYAWFPAKNENIETTATELDNVNSAVVEILNQLSYRSKAYGI